MKNKTRKYVMPLLAALPALSVVSTGVVLASCSNVETVKINIAESCKDSISLSTYTAVKGESLTLIVTAKSGYVLNQTYWLYHGSVADEAHQFSEDETRRVGFDMHGHKAYLFFDKELMNDEICIAFDTVMGIEVKNYTGDADGGSHFKIEDGEETTFAVGRPFHTTFEALRGETNYRFYNAEDYDPDCHQPDHENGIYPFAIYVCVGEYKVNIFDLDLANPVSYEFQNFENGSYMSFSMTVSEETATEILEKLEVQTIDRVEVKFWMCEQYHILPAENFENIISIGNAGVAWEDHGATVTISPASNQFVLLKGTLNGDERDNNAIEIFNKNGQITTGYKYTVSDSREFATLTIDDRDAYYNPLIISDLRIKVDYATFINAKVESNFDNDPSYSTEGHIVLADPKVLQWNELTPGVFYESKVSLDTYANQYYEIAEVYAKQVQDGEEKVIQKAEDTPASNYSYHTFKMYPSQSQEMSGIGYINNVQPTIHVTLASTIKNQTLKKADGVEKTLTSNLLRLTGFTGEYEERIFSIPVSQLGAKVEAGNWVNNLSVALYGDWTGQTIPMSIGGAEIKTLSGSILQQGSDYTYSDGIISFADGKIQKDEVLSIKVVPATLTNFSRYGQLYFWQDSEE